jgi:hypothetical protein
MNKLNALRTLLLATLLPLFSQWAYAQTEGGTPPPASLPATAPTAPTAANAANAVTQAAVQHGVLTCVSRINQVTNFLGFGPQAGALLMAHAQQPDTRLLPLAMEVPTEAGSTYVSATFAPGQANGCGAAYEAVSYWPQKCDAVAAKQFVGFKRMEQALRKNITVLDGGAATKVFLMPAGSGCVAIKKEVVL